MTPHECILACFAIASSGHLEEAKANLLHNRPCLETEEGLDLLARIELRLGNETEARRLWTQAVDSGVGGRRSRCALDALDSVAWRHRRLIRNVRRGFVIGIPALLGLLIGIAIREAPRKDALGCATNTDKTLGVVHIATNQLDEVRRTAHIIETNQTIATKQ